MITKEELVSRSKVPKFKIISNGGFGTGKTFLSMTAPKWAYAMIEPNGIMTAMSNPQLMENMVHYEDLVPTKLDLKQCFDAKIPNYLAKVRQDIEAGLVETFILDNLSHLSENRWMYIDTFEPAIVMKAGKSTKDNRSQYGNLGRWLYKFILTEIVSLPCNVFVNVHIMDETEEQETSSGENKQVKTGSIITNTLGGFREDAAGLFNANIFLEVKNLPEGKYEYQAICRPTTKYPTAKNNIGLPQIVKNISFQTLCESIGLNKQATKKEEVNVTK